MTDPRHPEDSLFFVAESDYRFYPEDCIQDWYAVVQDERVPWLDETLAEVDPPDLPPAEQEPSPAPVEGDDPSPSPDEKEKEPKRRKYLGWMAAQRPTVKATNLQVSQELRDLVQLCNRAAALGRGHVVWLGWCSKNKRKSVASFGTHLVAVSKYGAQKMAEAMEIGELKMGHWDQVLRQWLVNHNYQSPKVCGGSFVWPSVGFYQTHKSGCEPSIGERVAEWDQSYIQAGVRPKKGSDRKRWIACWPQDEKGHAEWLEEVTFDARRNYWLTQRPPDRWWSTDNEWSRLLWNRWWIDRDNNWVGPVWAAEKKGKGKGKRNKNQEDQQSPAPANKWKDLLERPDEYEWDYANNCYVPITRLAEQLVVDWDNWDWNGQHSNREWNTRKNIAFYKRRLFPDTDEEQASKKKVIQ